MVNLANWQQEEPTGYGGGRQLSMDGTSRVTGDSHARFCERLGVKFPGPTRRRSAMVVPTATHNFAYAKNCVAYPDCAAAKLNSQSLNFGIASTRQD